MSPHVIPAETRSDEQRKVYEEIARSCECPFCEPNFQKKHKKPILRQTSHWTVTENQWPYEGAQLCVLLVYRTKHVRTFAEIPSAAQADFFDCVAWVNERYEIESGAVVIRYGKPGDNGASVEHLHGHVVVGFPKALGGQSLKVKIGYKKPGA
jgi:diadenosine tetraphosphate (Ap4A) HIT family hydrolase